MQVKNSEYFQARIFQGNFSIIFQSKCLFQIFTNGVKFCAEVLQCCYQIVWEIITPSLFKGTFRRPKCNDKLSSRKGNTWSCTLNVVLVYQRYSPPAVHISHNISLLPSAMIKYLERPKPTHIAQAHMNQLSFKALHISPLIIPPSLAARSSRSAISSDDHQKE